MLKSTTRRPRRPALFVAKDWSIESRACRAGDSNPGPDVFCIHGNRLATRLAGLRVPVLIPDIRPVGVDLDDFALVAARWTIEPFG